MNIGKLEILANMVLNELPDSFYKLSINLDAYSKFNNLMSLANDSLPEYSVLFESSIQNSPSMSCYNAQSVVKHLLKIIQLEKKSTALLKEGKIFASAEEKMKQVNNAFKNEDYESTLNNLNSAFELVLKDKIGIPSTITGINTANIVEILIKYKVEPYLYLNEVRKRVTDIDNKVKHQGYCPSKIDAINAIGAMEKLIEKLRNTEFDLQEDVRNKICEGL